MIQVFWTYFCPTFLKEKSSLNMFFEETKQNKKSFV